MFHCYNKQHVAQYTTPMATLPLSDNGFEIGHVNSLTQQHCFVVFLGTGGEYYFAAVSEEEKKEWITAIKTKRKKLKFSESKVELYEPTPKEASVKIKNIKIKHKKIK